MTVTLIVICYDVTDDRRRAALFKLLSRYGDAIQYSLFECQLTQRQIHELKAAVSRLIDCEDDDVRYYEICSKCLGYKYALGKKPTPQPLHAMVF